MTRRRSRWEEQLGEEMPCVRCGETRDSTELDRMLWCESCVSEVRSRSSRVGWTFGLALSAALAAWIWIVVRPSGLVPGVWLAILVAAAWLGAKLAREVAFGIYRARK